MKPELVHQFNLYIQESRKDLLLSELKSLRKRKLSIMDRISISDFYDRVSEFYEAFVVLGSKNLNFGADDLKSAEDLLLRAACAQKLSNYGAKYMALKILQIVLDRTEKLTVDDQILRRIYFYQANILYSYNFYRKALVIFKKLSQDVNKGEQHKVLFLLAGCYSATGDFEKAEKLFLQLIKNSQNLIIKGISHLDLGTLYFQHKKNDQAEEHFQKALELIDNEGGGIDRAYLYKWWGYFLFEKGKKTEGQAYLKKALELIFCHGHFPHAIYEVLYFCYKAQIKLSLEQMITLYGFYEYNHYHKVLLNEIPSHEEKVIVIRNGQLAILNYEEIQFEDNFIDLVGGYLRMNTEAEFLSLINWRCLYALCLSNSQGVSKFALTDFVYLDKFVDIGRTVLKLLKLLQPLEKYFDKLEIKDSIYFCKLRSDLQYILPLEKGAISFERFLQAHKLTKTSKKSIQEYFQISPKVLKNLEARTFI